MKIVFAFLALSLCLSSTSFAQEKPKTINFTQKLAGPEGKPLPAPDAKDGLTLGDVAVQALEAVLDEDKGISGLEKFKRDQLARKIYGHSQVTLTVEEISLIKDRVGKAFGPVVIGAAWPLLDPALTLTP